MDILGVIGGITGIVGMIISLLGARRERYLAVHEFLTKIESNEFIEAKKYVYNNSCEIDNNSAAVIVNFFHHWGMLAKRCYLPMWVFDGATGNGACRLYERTKDYIESRRKLNNDELYGEYFEWLYKKLKSRRGNVCYGGIGMKRNKATKQIIGIMLGYSLAAIITGLLLGNISETFSGFVTILTSPAQLTIDYFKLGTIGGTYLNSGLVGLGCVFVLWLSRFELNGTSLMAFFLCIGFSFFGINFLNIWPCILGVWLFTRFAKKPFSSQVNVSLFATCMAPFVSEMLFRYPVFDGLAYAWLFKILAGLLVGIFAGVMMSFMCPHGANLHRGYSLYNAAAVGGFAAIFIFSLLFKATGVEIPTNTDLGESEAMIVNTFSIVVAVLAIIIGFFMNGRSFKGYTKVITATGFRCDFTQSAGVPLTLINIGVFGLFVTAYYNIVGANFTGPTQGCMMCLLAITACGAHPLNMLPIMIGYWIATLFCDFELSTQAIVVGLCFSGALVPVSGCFGSVSGIAAGVIHAIMVTNVVSFHGGFLLYNGGFTSALVNILLIPVLDYYFQPSQKLRLLPMREAKATELKS